MQTNLEFHYYFDPLCGWCYASAPDLAALAERHGDRLKMMPTGLFVAPHPVSAMADHAWTNDQRISGLTGQPFTGAHHRNVLLVPDGVVSSEALSLGLVALGETDPDWNPATCTRRSACAMSTAATPRVPKSTPRSRPALPMPPAMR